MSVVTISASLSQVTVTYNGVTESAIAAHSEVFAVGLELLTELKNA